MITGKIDVDNCLIIISRILLYNWIFTFTWTNFHLYHMRSDSFIWLIYNETNEHHTFFTFEVLLYSLTNVQGWDPICSECTNRSYYLEQAILFRRGEANCLCLFTLCVCPEKLERRQLYLNNHMQVHIENAILFARASSEPSINAPYVPDSHSHQFLSALCHSRILSLITNRSILFHWRLR